MPGSVDFVLLKKEVASRILFSSPTISSFKKVVFDVQNRPVET